MHHNHISIHIALTPKSNIAEKSKVLLRVSPATCITMCITCITIHIALTPISNIVKKVLLRVSPATWSKRGCITLHNISISTLCLILPKRCYSESHRQRGPREGGNRARENAARDETEQLHNLDKIDKVGQIMPRHLSLSFR